jgi:hypothetical protein
MKVDSEQCKLCLQIRRLRKSHLLPAALWRGARDPRLANPNPVVMTRTAATTSSSQLRERLLCAECEDRFNKNGERYVLSWLAPRRIVDGTFPLLDRLKIALEISRTDALNIYSGSNIGVDTEKFAYFALSILWRSAVHRWRFPGGNLTKKIDLREYEEPIRKYLLSEASFPDAVVIVFTVCTDSESRGSFYPPTLSQDTPFQTYGLLTQGVRFDISIGENVPLEMRQCCCVSSQQHCIFSRNCHDGTFRAFAALASTSRPAPNLLRH